MYKAIFCFIFLIFSSLSLFASTTIDKQDEIDVVIEEMIEEMRHSNQTFYLLIVSKDNSSLKTGLNI